MFISDPDIVCFSHLRWGFVYQRPQHLLTRAARNRRVFYVEEAEIPDGEPTLEVRQEGEQLWVVVPQISLEYLGERRHAVKRRLLDSLFAQYGIERYVAWYYTPAAMAFTRHLTPALTVYDCMDELSLFKGAQPELREFERELFRRADLVFTGGASLYEAKQAHHADLHLFPSSIEMEHFVRAREVTQDPSDQAGIPHPRLGYYGVIDERMDLALLDAVARARPNWQLVLIGPVVRIEEGALPRRPNIHYLGSKAYADLPRYLAGWDVALLPFALNDATRFVSPTKIPEYLAAGRPVVSTPIQDVVQPYGEQGLLKIARTPDEFVGAVETELSGLDPRTAWLDQVDLALAENSWDRTWQRMAGLIEAKRCLIS